MEEYRIIHENIVGIFIKFYEMYMPFMLFLLCYLLFKKPPNKKPIFIWRLLYYLLLLNIGQSFLI